MTVPGGPGGRGRHSAGDGTGGFPSSPWNAGARPPVPGGPGLPSVGPGHRTDAGSPSGAPGRRDDATGPLPDPARPSSGSTDHADHPRARLGDGNDVRARRTDGQHPSAPLPPRPSGVWGRLQPRATGPADDDDATVAAPPFEPAGDAYADPQPSAEEQHPDEPRPEPHPDEQHHEGDTESWDRTGGLDVIGAHVDGGTDGQFLPDDTGRIEDLGHDDEDGHGGAVPLTYDRRGGRSRRRRPLAVLLSLLVLGGLVVGIVLGVQALLGLTEAEDYSGAGTGSVEIRVEEGDTLSDIARTLVDADVIASTRPFVDAAEGRPEATGIQPGLYAVRSQMSGEEALDMLLASDSRLVSRVTVPEGLTVAQTLQTIAAETGRPIEELQAAADDIAALGLPAYAGGQLEGYLFPATYDVDPDQTSAEILSTMVAQFSAVAGRLQLEQRAAALGLSPEDVVTVASMIQSETRLDEERPDVAQVIYNRLAQGVRLGIDATLAYGLNKSGNELTVADLQSDNPYNTRTQDGLPPTPISSPGEASLEAALAPSSGDLLYYVLESADGQHFFTADYAEFLAARQRCAEAGLGCGG